MQHDSKSGGRAPLRIDSLAATLEQGIENEAAVLDLLVQAAAKGNPHPELWAKVHVAAARDDRFSELAFAYERLCGDRKFSLLPPAVQADALMHAAVFFADVFGDPAGARGYLERVMAIAPGRADAFAQLAALLSDGHEAIKLADLHVAAAAHRERGEQLSMLRRAIEILDAFPGEEERAIKINQQILKLEPGDPRARRALEERLSKAGRVADVAKLLEQAIAADPPPPEAEALQIRGRLISIYTTDLAREIERALPHVEEVLQHDPQHAGAIAAAEALLARKAVAPRAAAALEGAYDRQGRASDAARMMSLQIEQLRGPKRVEVQKRLADLMFQKLGDLAGAHALCEGIVTADPADDRFRERYLSLSAALDKRLEATRALGRAATLAKEKPLRARMGVEMGELYVDLGDPRKARASFQQVIEGGADEGAVLRAARGLAKLCEKEKDSKGLAATLERLADIEPEAEAREEASEQLARLCEAELHDAAGAAAAYRRLIGTRREGPALEALERIYEASGAHAELAGVLERRAEAEPDRAAARELALRAAELRSTKLSDRGAAIEAWRRFVAAFGASREAHAQLLPLLEQERRWGDLAEALAAEAGLAAGPERAATLARLGTVRATRLGDAAGALAAYRQALSIDPTERTSRLVVEKMLAAGADDMRLAACAVLEPIARGEGAAALLLRVLEVKAELAGSGIAEVVPPAPPAVSVHEAVTQPPPASWDWAAASAEVEVSVPRTPPPPADLSPAAGPPHSTRRGGIEERLAALEEAVGLSEHEMKDARKALDLASRGLRLAVDGAPAQIARWIGEVERLTGHGSEAGQRAAALAGALGDRQVTSAALSHLARRAGEALIASGEAVEALAVYRRALAFEPSSPELIARVDELLREQGSPEERIALDREALAQPCEPARRRELLHAIGAIQRRDLGDLAAAAATYRAALADDADDAAAYEALLDTCAAAGAWNAVLEELSARLPRVPAEERTAHELRMAGAAARAGREDEAAARYREILAGGAPLGDEALAAIEELGRGIGDDALLRRVFERRVEVSVDPQDEALWLERLGDLSARGDMAAAAAAWRRAAALAEGPRGDGGRARRLHEQVLAALPEDRLAAARLLAIYQEQGAWERVPAVCEVLLDTAASAAEALAELSVLEEAARRARATDRFLAAAARLRARLDAEAQAPDVGGAEADPARRRVVEAAVARVLGADPDRQDEAAAAHRRLVESAPEGDTQAIEAFRAFLAESPESPARRDDRRWLFGWVAARAPEGERVRALAAWAEWEEGEAGDRAAAAEIYARILEIDPDHDGALGSRARVLLDLGDFEGAARAIEARRDRSEGAARAVLDVSLAALLFDRLDRPAEALAAIAPALEAGAVDRAALDLVERALGRPEAQARAAELLERAEAAIEDGDAKVALLELLLVRGPQDPGARRRWYERLLERQEGTPERALDAALRAVAELPFEMSLWERAESLGRAGKQPERVIAAYTAALDAARPGSDPDALEELGRRAVEYHEEWFDAPETTIKLLSRLVELAPGSAWGFERLKLAYNAAERWEDLFTLYDGVLERTRDDRDRVFLLEDAATVARDLAGDPERTMKYLEALLPLRDDARARATLERLYERYGRHRPLIDLLQRDVPRLPADAAQKLRVRIALLWIEGVGDAPSALPIAEQMLEGEGFGAEGAPRGARPGAPSVNQGSLEAFDLLERILGATPAGQPARQRAAALLEGRYRAEGKPADLARVLEIQLEADDAGARPALLREIVRLRRDSLGDEAGAMDRLAELVELLPDAAEHRAELAELAARLGRHDEHARVLAAAAARAEDSARSIALLEEAATIRRDVLGDAAGAIDLLRRTFALAEEHGHAAAALGAARELDRLLAAGGRVAERCDVLDLLAARERDPAARRDALGELARLAARELGDDDRAIAAFTARLGDDGADLEALDGLVAILDQAGRFRELSAALDRRARVREAAGEGDDARRDLARVARLFERELEDPEQAVAIWIRIRAELGPDVESGEALATLHARAGRWAELVEIVEEEARAALGAGDAARAADLYRRLGDAHRDHTLVWERAVESYHRAHQAGRGRGGDAEAHAGGARAGLEALLGRLDLASGEHRAALVAATGALLEIAGSSDDWRARVALLEPRLATAESDEGRVEILREAAALLEQRGGDVGGAFDLIWRAFLISPGPDRPADLVRLADDAVRWGTIAGALPDLERRDDVPAPTLRDLWRRVAAWHRDARADAAAAESAVERALAHEATNAEILFELAELQRRTRGPALVGTLLRLADATGGDLALYREAVETARDALGDAGRAREIAGRMLDLAAAAWIGGDAEELVHQPSAPSAAALGAVDALAGMLAAEGDRAGVVAICRRGA
ncbi:MAG: hypothetical protein IT372_12520, partial [Polyangiaceae bacterium]|nr:hypothetical protein [Polyangiaceae bacterium]